MACGATPEPSAVLNAEALVARRPWAAPVGFAHEFLKNNTWLRPVCQELVDFPYRASRPSTGRIPPLLVNAEASHRPLSYQSPTIARSATVAARPTGDVASKWRWNSRPGPKARRSR